MKSPLFAPLIFCLTVLTATAAYAQEIYRMPPPEVAALVDAPSIPGLVLSPDRSLMLLLHAPGRTNDSGSGATGTTPGRFPY